MERRIEELLEQMTLEEKVSMVAGVDWWRTTTVERLGIPAIKMTDGPHGARGAMARGGPSSACFPVGTCMASTWNPELMERVGVALGEETKAKGAHILLGPTVNIHRSPLAGRNFECYSEDPYLTSRIAVAYIRGVQSQNVGACIKHFVCNDSEFERRTISSEVGERALREIYLPPFNAAVKEAEPWAVMSAYNKINGTYASENSYTLLEILKGEWSFEGIVISDWWGTYSTVPSVNGGLDLEMPGPPRFRGEKLLEAVREGHVSQHVIDDKIRRLLKTIVKSGTFENPEEAPEMAVDKPEHRELARQVAAEGIVLLKNERNVLPLDGRKVKSVAVIGPNAKVARIMGGGSSRVNPHYAVTPLEGIIKRCGDAIQVAFELGCTNHKMLPVIDARLLTESGDDAGQGLTGEFFNNFDLAGEPVLTEVAKRIDFQWAGEFSPVVHKDEFSARWSAKFTASETGVYTFSLISAGLSRLFVDGEQAIDNWTEQVRGEAYYGAGTKEMFAQVEMRAGQSYDIVIEYSKKDAPAFGGLRLGCLFPVPKDSIERAAEFAARSDVALIFVGTNDEWESEGFDRVDMELPGDQAELIKRVAAANENTVVVLNTGSPVAMSGWLDQVPSIVEAWFPGQECGNAIADVLFGDVNPSGKLPTTFPQRLEDNPAYINYPGENGQVLYGEGIFVGYRYYDEKKIEPLFPFGHGLSYTRFEYDNLEIGSTEYQMEDSVEVTVDVTNAGHREGKEVVQLYVRDVESSLVRPEKELKAFEKVALKPGETKSVHFTLGQDALSFYDPARQRWTAEAGEFEILIGSSAHDIRAKGSFWLQAPPKALDSRLNTDSTLQEILDDEGGKAVLEVHLGDLLRAPQIGMAMGLSLKQMARYAPHILTPAKLQQIGDDLESL